MCAVKGWVSLKESLDKSIEGNPASVETYTGRSGKGKFYVVTLEGGGRRKRRQDAPRRGAVSRADGFARSRTALLRLGAGPYRKLGGHGLSLLLQHVHA